MRRERYFFPDRRRTESWVCTLYEPVLKTRRTRSRKVIRTLPPVFALLIFSNGKSTRSWASVLLPRPNCALVARALQECLNEKASKLAIKIEIKKKKILLDSGGVKR